MFFVLFYTPLLNRFLFVVNPVVGEGTLAGLVPGRGGRLRGVLLERKRVGVPGNERKTATFHFAFCPLTFRFFDHQRLLSPRVDDGIHETWARQKDV